MNKLPRNLVAYALVRDDYVQSGDLLQGLMPLFEPILAEQRGRIFDPTAFAREVTSRYDIPMAPLVAEGLVADMTHARLLQMEGDQHTAVYRVTKKLKPLKDSACAERLQSIISDFLGFSKKHLKDANREISQEKLETGLFERFKTSDFLGIVEQGEGEIEDTDREMADERAIDILCAEFVLSLSEQDLELLVSVIKGALIAELVLSLQARPTDLEILSNVSIVWDGPLLLDLLNLNTPELFQYATDLLELIKKTEMRSVAFRHYYREMVSIIEMAIQSVNQNAVQSQMVGQRIKADRDRFVGAQHLIGNLQTEIERRGFKTLLASDYVSQKYLQYCSRDLEDKIRNNLGYLHEKLEARERDALTVATTIRLRGRQRNPKTLSKAGWVFVTRNRVLAERSRKTLLMEKEFQETDFPVVISDRQLAGLLWLAVGGNLGSLSKKRLIANCMRVLTPGAQVVRKMMEVLNETSTEDTETFKTLVNDERVRRRLTVQTIGGPPTITPQNARQNMDELKAVVAQEYEQKLDTEQTKSKALKSEVSNLEGEVSELKSLFKNQTKSIERQVKRSGDRAERFSRFLIVGTFFAVLVLGAWLGLDKTMAKYVTGISFFLSAITFWRFPDILFGGIVKKCRGMAERRKRLQIEKSMGTDRIDKN
ncbi:MAG: hypothetical protein GXP09_00890 [Gammaproteobacteria bacterium]|nr:hypothetical protein [Gammaproteobacteria bacterium]